MPDFNFVGDAYAAQSIYQDAQECINWYPEIDQNKPQSAYVEQLDTQASRGVVALYPTPGMVAKVTSLPRLPVRGGWAVSGGAIAIVVVGPTAYKIDSSFTATSIGTLATSTGPVSISDNGIAVYLVDGANRYGYTISTNTFEQIADADGAFTGGDVVDTVDNYFIYNRPGTQQWAASDALSTVTQPLSFSSKDGAPDNLVTIAVNNREVWLLGERTSEVWIDTGSFPFPFSRIPGSNSQHGCIAAQSVANLGDTFAFLSADDRGQGCVLMAQGYSLVRISTHAVEADLNGQVLDDAIAFAYRLNGHEFYVLTLPTADKTWVYDLRTNMWHKWLWVDSYNVYHRHRASCIFYFQGMVLAGDFENGLIYQLTNTTFTDLVVNSSNAVVPWPIRRMRRAPHIVSDFQRVFHNELQIQFQPGVGIATGQGALPQAMLRWSDDGGAEYSNEHWTSIGATGQYKNRAIWRRLGVCRDRVYEVAISDPVNAVIVSANLKAIAGSN